VNGNTSVEDNGWGLVKQRRREPTDLWDEAGEWPWTKLIAGESL
jgi:hypothetical protein